MPVVSDAPVVSDTQKRLVKLDPSDDNYRTLLRELLSHKDLKAHIQDLDGPELEGFVELLDDVSGKVVSTPPY